MSPSPLDDRDETRCDRTQVGHALRRSLALNAWLAATTASYVFALLVIRHHPDWSPGGRAALMLAPILPGLLYLRNGVRVLRAMDELQRRIQLEAWLFAALGTVIVGAVINVFNAQGLYGTWPAHGLEVGGTYLTMFILWSIGVVIATLRYR